MAVGMAGRTTRPFKVGREGSAWFDIAGYNLYGVADDSTSEVHPATRSCGKGVVDESSQFHSMSVSWLQIAWKGVGEYVHALTRALPWAGVWPSVGRR